MSIAEAVSTAGACPRCDRPFSDPEAPGLVTVSVDLEAGDYGEDGWVGFPSFEASVLCQGRDPQNPGQSCTGAKLLDERTVLELAVQALNDRLVTELRGGAQ